MIMRLDKLRWQAGHLYIQMQKIRYSLLSWIGFFCWDNPNVPEEPHHTMRAVNSFLNQFTELSVRKTTIFSAIKFLF